MKGYLVRLVSGVAIHFPQPYAVIHPQLGEIGRAQTAGKAERLCRALDLLERYERGELLGKGETALPAASD